MIKKSFIGFSLSLISAAVFFVVLVNSYRMADNHAQRVYASIQKHTKFIHEVVQIAEASPLSMNESTNMMPASDLSTCTPVNPPSTTEPALKSEAVDPDDSATEAPADQKGTKPAVAKCKETIAPSHSGSNPINNKIKVTPLSNKSKMQGAQKHFGVGLRFTI